MMDNPSIPLSPQAQQLLAQLQDIQLPSPVGWWPPSHLILVLIIGLGGFLIWAIWYQWYRHKMNRYRKEAQQLLQEKLAQAQTPQAKILATNLVLKRVAITNYGRSRVASLTGQNWLNFLQETALYLDPPENLLETLQSAYQHQVDELALTEFIHYAKVWIKGHHK